MVWYGMVWYGMVWYGMVWYGMVWYGMVWYGMVWYGMVWYGMVWYGMVWYGMVSLAEHGCTQPGRNAAGLLLGRSISGCGRSLLRLNGDKSAGNYLQARYKLTVKTFYPQASWTQHMLDASCFNNLQQVCKYQVASSTFTCIEQAISEYF